MEVLPRQLAQVGENQLVAALPLRDRACLLSKVQVVQLRYRQVVQFSGERIGVVHFPITAVLSLMSVMSDGSSTELGIVGSMGMAGLPALLGTYAQPFEMVVVASGTAYQMSASTLDEATHHSVSLESLLLRYAQVFFNQVAQGIACTSHHSVRQRLARILMTLHDNTQMDRLRVTQEFLGQMLGVGRPRVSLASTALQHAGLIQCSRGITTVLDRSGLAAVACECYQIIREEYDHLYTRMASN